MQMVLCFGPWVLSLTVYQENKGGMEIILFCDLLLSQPNAVLTKVGSDIDLVMSKNQISNGSSTGTFSRQPFG